MKTTTAPFIPELVAGKLIMAIYNRLYLPDAMVCTSYTGEIKKLNDTVRMIPNGHDGFWFHEELPPLKIDNLVRTKIIIDLSVVIFMTDMRAMSAVTRYIARIIAETINHRKIVPTMCSWKPAYFAAQVIECSHNPHEYDLGFDLVTMVAYGMRRAEE